MALFSRIVDRFSRMGSYAKSKGRSNSKIGYFAIPNCVMDHPNFCRLSGNAAKLLLWFGRQYNGGNNGDLSATWKQVHDRGFKSESTLSDARTELVHYGLTVTTRQGGVNKPTLYALTWHPIHECKGKLDIAPSQKSPDSWKENRPDFESRSKRSRRGKLDRAVAMCSNVVAMCSNEAK